MDAQPCSIIEGDDRLTGRSGLIDTYLNKARGKLVSFLWLVSLLFGLTVLAIAVGSYDLGILKIIKTLLGLESGPQNIVIWSIRMPRIIAAIVAGCGLGLSGIAFQTLLKNPIASPFTLGVSQGAAFGAAFAIVVIGAGEMQASALRTANGNTVFFGSLYFVTFFAFLGAIGTTVIILALARLKKMASESIILAGVALSSLAMSGTILVQYFASEIEIAMVVFWTFGDVARSSWPEIILMTVVTLAAAFYYFLNRWNLNALSLGEDEAGALGVNIEKLRLTGMFIAALVIAMVTAFHGVIAFLGLLAPHIGRRLAGSDHRYLIPFSCLIGSLLLLAADTIGRVFISSGTLPVGVLTSFMGAPLFLYLLIKGIKS